MKVLSLSVLSNDDAMKQVKAWIERVEAGKDDHFSAILVSDHSYHASFWNFQYDLRKLVADNNPTIKWLEVADEYVMFPAMEPAQYLMVLDIQLRSITDAL